MEKPQNIISAIPFLSVSNIGKSLLEYCTKGMVFDITFESKTDVPEETQW